MLSYLVPLRTDDCADVADLAAYLQELRTHVNDVVVVDNSSAAEIARHRRAFGDGVRVLVSCHPTPMGKVGNVMTGLEHAQYEKVVVADDDIRYTPEQLADISVRLDAAAVIRPQNFFRPCPWHARIDTARTLLARATGGDWPGTLAVRRTFLLQAGGYDGNVLFENLELVRTVRAFGGREEVAYDLLVARTPPTVTHFVRQQVRQAYDEFARPERLLVSLVFLPLTAIAARRRYIAALLAAAVATSALAEGGRRRAGGRLVYPASSVLLAPPWLVWRSACSWVALGAFARGGARYRGARLRRAATPMRKLRARKRRSASFSTIAG